MNKTITEPGVAYQSRRRSLARYHPVAAPATAAAALGSSSPTSASRAGGRVAVGASLRPVGSAVRRVTASVGARRSGHAAAPPATGF